MLVGAIALLAGHGAIGMLIAASLARAPTRPSFYRLTLLVALAGLTLALALRLGSASPVLPPLNRVATIGYGLAVVAAVACGLRLQVAPQGQPFGWLMLAAAGGGLAVLSEPTLYGWREATGSFGAALYFAGLATVAVAVGSVIFAMLLAHWYLVEPRLPLVPLQNVLLLFVATEVLKVLLMAGVIGFHWPQWIATEGGLTRAFTFGNALFVGMRAMLGVLAPLGLAWLTWKTVKIRSIQSATGILYAAVVLVLFGETITVYLSLATGQPY